MVKFLKVAGSCPHKKENPLRRLLTKGAGMMPASRLLNDADTTCRVGGRARAHHRETRESRVRPVHHEPHAQRVTAATAPRGKQAGPGPRGDGGPTRTE